MIFEKIELEEEEEILRIVHRHWFFVFKQCVVIVFSLILPMFTLSALQTAIPGISSLLAPYFWHIIFIYSFWVLLNWMILATIWTNQYLDIWCVTNRRIVKINQVGLFNREIGSFRLERLQDINVEVKGIIATFLDFGTIHAQTASTDLQEFKESYLPKPQEIKSLILKASDQQMPRGTL